jgi:hypothetical protein
MSEHRSPPDVVAGYHWEAVQDHYWELLPLGAPGKRCRGDNNRCRLPAVAFMWRHNSAVPAGRARWNYCAGHMYGRWIDGDKVMCWRHVKNGVSA